MHILIIQPPDFEKDFQGIYHQLHRVIPFGPPWNILFLRQYFQDRTRHIADYLDMRLFTSVEKELLSALSEFKDLKLAVIHCSTECIGCSAGIIELIKRHRPDLKQVLIGSFPTGFPERALDIPDVDFAIAGDPERPLQLLADNLDAPKLWQHVPGLIFPGHLPEQTFFWKNLTRRILPNFRGTFWGAYKRGPVDSSTRISAFLSSGHTGLPCDRAFGPVGQPLRVEDLDRMADCVQRGTHVEIESIHFEDAPGIWSPDRLKAWCNALIKVRNAQPWSFTMLPAYLDPDLCDRLAKSLCREIIFQLPSTEAEELKKYGCVIQPAVFKLTMEELRNARIRPIVQFLLGGPGHSEKEAKGILKWLKALRYPTYSMTPFPMVVDAPIYFESFHPDERVHLENRLRWARAPWVENRPLPIWGGMEDRERIQQVIQEVRSHDRGGLGSRFRRMLQRRFGRHFVRTMEDWATSLFPGTSPKHHR